MSINQVFILIILVCLSALGMAYGAEFFFDIKPCALCYWQRYLYIGTLAGAGVFLWRTHSKGLLVCAGGFWFNATVAFYQVMVEKHWIPAPAFCKKVGSGAVSLEDLRHQLKSAVGNEASCDVVPWELFGISIAGYNVLFCLSMGAVCIGAYRYFSQGKAKPHES